MSDGNVTGSVVVLGGGISGIQAALDMANGGFKVYVVESSPSVGGVMAKLDKTFPTNDCSSCMMGPKLVELANHPNIEIFAYSELESLGGVPRQLEVTVRKKARYVNAEKCVGCGICANKCPTKVPNEFNFGLDSRKAIYIPFPQAVPLVYTIDPSKCRQFTKGKCGICKKVCQNNAIEYDQKDELVTIKAGAIVVAGGYKPFNPGVYGELGYGRWPNVITSIEYERILSAAGPFGGHVVRPSDRKEPKKIAWIQCVGSRDPEKGISYCSSVCCMYATKQAMITKEHDPGVETSIFYIDMRAPGKGFDSFIERAKKNYGVRYIRSRISRIFPDSSGKMLEISYIKEDGQFYVEVFDMVVLSVGLSPNQSLTKLAQVIDIPINKHGFIETDGFNTTRTCREGIFVCGAAQEPKDIPESVQQGSSAAEEVMAFLASARNTLTAKPKVIEELDISRERPRIGVFVCHCGINIGGIVDVKSVAAYVKNLPDVAYVSDCMFACSTDHQREMQKVIKEHKLNRVVVASCTPRTHEPLFRNTLKEAGLNPYLFEQANIREHVSWVHQQEPEKATEKAKEVVRLAVARARLLEPLHDSSYEVVQRGLVIGGGLAGLTAAKELSSQGFEVVLVEKTGQLGGLARNLYQTETGFPVYKHVDQLMKDVSGDPKIKVFLSSEVAEIKGSCGRFTATVITGKGTEVISIGAVIVATGGSEYKPREYFYGEHEGVYTQRSFEHLLFAHPEEIKKIKNIVMIQCVGSREPDHPYCSRLCCTMAVKNSLRCKEINPDVNITILYRDIRTFGFREAFYRDARLKGIRFIRFTLENKPEVFEDASTKRIMVKVQDPILFMPLTIPADLLVLNAAIRPQAGQKDLGEKLRLPLDENGFFMEAHVKLRPLDFPTPGFFVCGLAQGPKFSYETVAQAKGAVARAVTILSKEKMFAQAVITSVDTFLCRACGECEKVCSFGAIKVMKPSDSEKPRAVVDPGVCTGCGACNVACPTGAASLAHFRDNQVVTMIDSIGSLKQSVSA